MPQDLLPQIPNFPGLVSPGTVTLEDLKGLNNPYLEKLKNGQVQLSHGKGENLGIFTSGDMANLYALQLANNHGWEHPGTLTVNDIDKLNSRPSNTLTVNDITKLNSQPSSTLTVNDIAKLNSQPYGILSDKDIQNSGLTPSSYKFIPQLPTNSDSNVQQIPEIQNSGLPIPQTQEEKIYKMNEIPADLVQFYDKQAVNNGIGNWNGMIKQYNDQNGTNIAYHPEGQAAVTDEDLKKLGKYGGT